MNASTCIAGDTVRNDCLGFCGMLLGNALVHVYSGWQSVCIGFFNTRPLLELLEPAPKHQASNLP